MIPIAIPVELRQSTEVKELLKKIAVGETGQMDLHELFMKPITDDQVKQYLRDSQAGESTPREELLTHVERSIRHMARQMSEQALGTMQGMPEFGSWQRMIKTIQRSAELIWRDFFADFRTGEEARLILQPPHRHEHRDQDGDGGAESPQDRADGLLQRLEQLTVVAHLLMLFGIEAALYQFRATANARAGMAVHMRRRLLHRPRNLLRARGAAFVGRRKKRRFGYVDTVRGRITYLVTTYQETLATWDEELVRITGRHFFRDQLGDAQRFKSLSKKFGPPGLDTREQGWAVYAADASSELHYLALDARRIEQKHSGRRLAAWASRLQKWTTGYGTKPGRFARTALFLIATFGLLFFANDYFNPGLRANSHFCPTVNFSRTPPWEIAVHYFYVAVTNLTSLGSNATLAAYCGGMVTELLLVAASLTGYFLLATLAALFFQLIRDTDS